jgi:hypothetical protein
MAVASHGKQGAVVVTFAAEEVEAFLHATKGSILHDVYAAVKALQDEAAAKEA